MPYLLISMKMENCDALSNRMAIGLISDLSNSIGSGIMPWMNDLLQLLQNIMIDNSFDSEAKLVAIIAFGDLSLAAGAQNYMQYLQETIVSFTSASQISLSPS